MGEQQKRLGRAANHAGWSPLVVLASQNVQVGVQTLVDEITKHPPTYEQSIELHYFVVPRKPAASPQPPPAGVSEIQPALDEIARSQGAQTLHGRRAHPPVFAEWRGREGRGPSSSRSGRDRSDQRRRRLDRGAAVRARTTGSRRGSTSLPIASSSSVPPASIPIRPDASTLYYVVRVAPRADGKRP